MTISLSAIKQSTERIFSRSSGPGGQHVNKTSSRVQLTFDILGSSLSDTFKTRLLRKYKNGFIRVENQETRSQSQNTRLAFQQLFHTIEKGVQIQKRRKKSTAPHLTPKGKKKKMRHDKLMKYKQRYL